MQAGVHNLADLGDVAGTPMVSWVSSFRMTYSTTKIGLQFNGWPDGRAMEDQPQVMLSVFEILRDETVEVLKEEAERK